MRIYIKEMNEHERKQAQAILKGTGLDGRQTKFYIEGNKMVVISTNGYNKAFDLEDKLY